jgi:Flp pilus assembly protein TadG
MKRAGKESGQALILIVFAAVGLIAFVALAIDGSRIFSDKRHAQNTADAAALAASLAYTRGDPLESAATTSATTNGYDGGVKNDVAVTSIDIAEGSGICPGDTAGKDITVKIESYVDTTFTRVIGRNQFKNITSATSRGCGYYSGALFNGNAIVGLKPNINGDCSFDSGNSNAAHWTVTGGGIFSNGCAYSKNNASVTLDPDQCVTSVGTASGFTCSHGNQSSQAINYPADVLAIMPPNPCDGTPGDVGLPQGSGSKFIDGIYCITNLDALDKKNIVLYNATLYVTDPTFDLKFAGSGGFYGTPTQSGKYAGYYMIVAYNPTPCPRFTSNNTQVIEWRGNGAGTFYGTVLAPSACIDLRGNADQSAMHSQIISYIVGSNGNAEVYVNYEADENHHTPVNPSITLIK